MPLASLEHLQRISLGPQAPLALPGLAERTGPRLLARDDQPSLADDAKNRFDAPATPRRATALSAGLRPRVFIIHILSLDKKDIAMAGYVSNPKVLSGLVVSRSGIDVTKHSKCRAQSRMGRCMVCCKRRPLRGCRRVDGQKHARQFRPGRESQVRRPARSNGGRRQRRQPDQTRPTRG